MDLRYSETVSNPATSDGICAILRTHLMLCVSHGTDFDGVMVAPTVRVLHVGGESNGSDTGGRQCSGSVAEGGSPAAEPGTLAPSWKASLRWLLRALVLLATAGCALGYRV